MQRAGQDAVGDIAHARPLTHRRALDEGERVAFLHAVLVDEHALGPVDGLARFQLLAKGIDLAAELLQLAKAPDGHFDRGDQVALLVRLHQVRQRAGIASILHDFALAEGGEHEHAADSLAADDACGLEAVHVRHLDVENGQVGPHLAHELDGLVAAAGLTDDLVALFLEGLAQIEANDGFVFGDHHTDGHRWRPFGR